MVLAGPKQVTYADLGGIDSVLDDIKELIERPLQHPEVSTNVMCALQTLEHSHNASLADCKAQSQPMHVMDTLQHPEVSIRQTPACLALPQMSLGLNSIIATSIIARD